MVSLQLYLFTEEEPQPVKRVSPRLYVYIQQQAAQGRKVVRWGSRWMTYDHRQGVKLSLLAKREAQPKPRRMYAEQTKREEVADVRHAA